MLRNEFRNRLESIVGDFTSSEIKDPIERVIFSKGEKKNVKGVSFKRKGEKEKADEVVESLLKVVNFKKRFMQHPLVWKTINWGNASKEYRKSDAYKRIQNKLTEILEKQKVEVKDLEELTYLLRELRRAVIDFIERRVSDVKQGLGHIHAPGSVAKSEARNLDFGERFAADDLYKLALRLCSSIAFGESIGIYSEDESFMRKMRQLIESLGFGLPFRIEEKKLKEIGIQEHDRDHPYVVLLKFIMWLRDRIDVEENPEKRKICLSILDMLRSNTISMFFMPEEKERWRTISIPRLDFFISNWIQRDEKRKDLKALVDNIDIFVRDALRKLREKKEVKKAKNTIDMLMNNYEILCRQLIEYGVPDFYALRNIMDIVVDLSVRHDIRFHFKSLILAI
ncbi:MAG: hypothetical protein QW186_08215 [Candidatus Bathyarchaeia archaeon]